MGARLFAVLFAVCGIIVDQANLSGDLIKVVVLDHDAGSDAGFGTGGRYASAYADMVNLANFGSGGTVDRTFQFLDPVTNLDSISLADVGLVILAHSHLKSTSFNDGVKLDSYVKNDGGSVLALGHSFSDIEGTVINDYSGIANLSSWWTGNPGHLPNKLTGVNAYKVPNADNMTVNAVGSGPASGSFGDVQLSTVRSDANEYWSGTTSGATGTFALSYNSSSSTFSDGLYGDYGNGRFLMVGSVNMFGDGDVGGSTLSSRYAEANNQTFFLNSIEYLSESTITATSTPEPSSLILAASLGFGVLLRRRKRSPQA